jgi:hypothetical protein
MHALIDFPKSTSLLIKFALPALGRVPSHL